MRIREKCSCGAEIEVQDDLVDSVQPEIEKWRKDHVHTVLRAHSYPYVTYSGAGYVVNGEGEPVRVQ